VRSTGISLVAELLFDRRMVEGETAVLSYTVTDGTGKPCPGYVRMFCEPAGPYLRQVEVSSCLPARCRRETQMREHLPPLESEELLCDRSGVFAAYFPRWRQGWRASWSSRADRAARYGGGHPPNDGPPTDASRQAGKDQGEAAPGPAGAGPDAATT
jgi:hypothetical protein